MMKISQHGQYLTQITRLRFVNCYLVREADGFTVIDTGIGGSAKDIVKAAQELGAPIRRISLTHAHLDHVGSLDALHQLVPDAEVSISARDARFLKGDKSLDADEPQSKLKGSFTVVETTPNRLLKEGDTVGSLQVIASPGHTPGHIAFFDPRDKTLIAGDAFTTTAGTSTAGTLRWLFPLTAIATWDKPTGLRSAEKLVALKPSRLAVGHGRVLDQHAVTEMQAAIDEARKKLNHS